MKRHENRRRAEAAEWFARRRRQLLPDEETAFSSWINAPENWVAYEEISLVWDVSGELHFEIAKHDVRILPPSRQALRRRRTILAAAACALMVVAAGTLLVVDSVYVGDEVVAVSSQQTDVGEVETFTIADNVTATLNANSELRVEMNNDGLNVNVLRGEVYLAIGEVFPGIGNASSTDIVAIKTPHAEIVTQNARFTVHLDDDATRISLLEGFVEFSVTAEGIEHGGFIRTGSDVLVRSDGTFQRQRLNMENHAPWRFLPP